MSDDDAEARRIPDPLQRQVRQKCGFGCVICGLPVFDYEHIEEWSKVREHKLENIVLLCPGHHAEKTRKRLSKEVVVKAAAEPFNLGKAYTSGHLHLMVGSTGSLTVGGNIYDHDFKDASGTFAAIQIQGRTYVGLTSEDGWLLLDLTLTDSAGAVILAIERGVQRISTGVWDYAVEGPRMVVRSSPREIEFSMDFLPNGVSIQRAQICHPPFTLVVTPDNHQLMHGTTRVMTMIGNRLSNCRVGLSIG